LGPQSRIRRTIRSDALKTNNAINLKNKSKVNDILHEVVDNNNNNTHTSKEERKSINKKKHASKMPVTVGTNGHHSKDE
jgi:hypothetical protein